MSWVVIIDNYTPDIYEFQVHVVQYIGGLQLFGYSSTLYRGGQ